MWIKFIHIATHWLQFFPGINWLQIYSWDEFGPQHFIAPSSLQKHPFSTVPVTPSKRPGKGAGLCSRAGSIGYGLMGSPTWNSHIVSGALNSNLFLDLDANPDYKRSMQ